MREAHPRERQVGMGVYASDAPGVGGALRGTPDDFRVREVEAVDPAPLDGDVGDYPHVLLRATLRSWDTNDFAARLSDALGVSRERVSWAGTKDKHAVTTQLFSVRDVDPEAIPDVDGAEIELVGRLGRTLQFGDLAGNEFVVRARELDVDAETAATRIDAIAAELAAVSGVSDAEGGASDGTGTNDADAGTARTVGVPNYFGHQRFGSRRPVTHEVGLHVVRGEWREAVLAYCGAPADSEPERTREARAFVDEQAASADPDWAAAVERMPGYLRYERSMLHRLADPDPPADVGRFRHALEAVPSNLQRLFVNAAQSYAFNRIVTARLEAGLPLSEPVEGDVVCFTDRDRSEAFAVPDPGREQRVTGRRVDVVAKHCARGRAFVTAPLVGTETELADGEPGELEREVLDELDLSPEDFELPGAFGSTGTRRAVLVRTDLAVTFDADGESEGEGEGDTADPTFEFALPKGSYATVLLREFLKTDPLSL